MNNQSSQKRKNTSVEMHIKLTAINKVKSGIPKNVVANELGVHLATVENWWKRRKNLEKWESEHSGIVPSAQKRLKKPVHALVDRAMWLWYQEYSGSGRGFSGPGCKVQALHFKSHFEDETAFSASQGWLSRWMQRYSIAGSPNSEKTQAEVREVVELFRVKFKEVVEGLGPEQIFICDRNCLNIRQMPRVVQEEDSEDAPETQTERVTLMACANASGTLQLPLVIVGKYLVPRGLETATSLPVSYKDQQSAYLTGTLFREWFMDEFYPLVTSYLESLGLPPRAALFVDNCVLLPEKVVREDVKVMFLPPSTSHVLQPFEQSWTHRMKQEYRKQFLRFVVGNVKNGLSLDEALNSLTMREVVTWLSESWEATRREDLIKVWTPIWPEVGAHVDLPEVDVKPNVTTVDSDTESVREFCEILTKTEEYRDLTSVDVEKWLRPSTRLTEDECLDDLEVVQVIKEEHAINEKNAATAQCEIDREKQEAREKRKEAEKLRESRPKVHIIAPPTTQRTENSSSSVSENSRSSQEISVPGRNLMNFHGGGILEEYSARCHDKPKMTLQEAQEELEKVIKYCAKSPHYTKEQCLALIDLREAMRAEANMPQLVLVKEERRNFEIGFE